MVGRFHGVRLRRRNIQHFQPMATTYRWRRTAKTLRFSRPRIQLRLVARQEEPRRLARQTARRRATDYKPALTCPEQEPGYAERNDDGHHLVYCLPLKKLAADKSDADHLSRLDGRRRVGRIRPGAESDRAG